MITNTQYPNLFEQTFEDAPTGIALVSPEGAWIKVNKALCTFTGFSENELLQKTFQDITHPDDLAADLLHVKEALDGKTSNYSMEKRYITKSGEAVWAQLSVTLVKDEGGKPAFFISHIEDIQRQKELELKLQTDADYLSSIINAVADPLFVKDGSRRWVIVNDAFCNLMGQSRQDLIGNTAYDFLPKDEADVFAQVDEKIYGGAKMMVNEVSFIAKDGVSHSTIIKKSLYISPSGEKFIVGTVHDISESKAKEDELDTKNKELEQMNKMMLGREFKMIELKAEIKKLKTPLA